MIAIVATTLSFDRRFFLGFNRSIGSFSRACNVASPTLRLADSMESISSSTASFVPVARPDDASPITTARDDSRMGVLEEVDAGHVRVLRLNRPERKNALTAELGWCIVNAVRRADADDGVRVIALTGNGDAFCSGLDLGPGEDTEIETG